MTGYKRTEIIPRNCRFLQTKETDKRAAKRIATAIEKRQQCVELLLNRKKSGEPFWNLLSIYPLIDEHGEVRFFLGGQIDCSSTMHNSPDVLRILATSNEPTEERPPPITMSKGPVEEKPRSRSMVKSLGFSNSRGGTNIQQRSPGMEKSVLQQLADEKTLTEQKRTFYAAYANVGNRRFGRGIVH